MFDLCLTLVAAISVTLLTANRPSSTNARGHTLGAGWSSRVALGLLLLRVAAGCSDIQAVNRHECGNHVLESGEDCDGATGCSSTCRFTCTARDPSCPAGWGCDHEAGFCRTSKGSFLPPQSLPLEDYGQLSCADFDGDARADLVFVGDGAEATSVSFFSSNGDIERSVSLPAASATTFGDVTADAAGRPELILGGYAVSAFQASKSRRFSPLISALARVPESALMLSADVDCDGLRDFLLLNGNELSRVEPSGALTHLGKLAISSTKLHDMQVGSLGAAAFQAVGRFEYAPGAACEMLALPGTTEGTVDVYGPSSANSTTVGRLSTLSYPADFQPLRILFADIDGDGTDDLLLAGPVEDDAGLSTNYVSYGVGDGSFHSDPLSLPAPFSLAGDGNAVKLNRPGEILAAGNASGEKAQFFSDSDALDGVFYSSARLLDLTGDGALDVAACADGRRLDVLRGLSTGHLSALSLPVNGIPFIQDVADFDGDGQRDVLLGEAPTLFDAPKTASVLFSQVSNASSGPVDLAEFTSIGQMVAGYLHDEANVADGNADIAVLYAGQDSVQKLGFLAGGSDRLLRSELPTEPAGDDVVIERMPVLGHFRDSNVRDLVVVEDLATGDDANSEYKTRLSLFSMGRDGSSQVATQPLASYVRSYGGLAAIDADGDNLDELYAAGDESLLALRHDGDSFQVSVALAEANLSKLRVQDANADGELDLTVTRDDQLWLLLGKSAPQASQWHHFSAKSLGCGEGELYYGFIQADQDPQLELALGCSYTLFAREGAPVGEPGGDTSADNAFQDSNLKICDVDLSSDTLTLAYTVPVQVSGDFVVGDFNGDGVQDIAGQFGAPSLLRGEPR